MNPRVTRTQIKRAKPQKKIQSAKGGPTAISIKLYANSRSSLCGAGETNPTSMHEDSGSVPGLAQWVKRSSVAASCVV